VRGVGHEALLGRKALLQARDHLVEGCGDGGDLVAARGEPGPGLEIPPGHPAGRGGQVLERPGQEPSNHQAGTHAQKQGPQPRPQEHSSQLGVQFLGKSPGRPQLQPGRRVPQGAQGHQDQEHAPGRALRKPGRPDQAAPHSSVPRADEMLRGGQRHPRDSRAGLGHGPALRVEDARGQAGFSQETHHLVGLAPGQVGEGQALIPTAFGQSQGAASLTDQAHLGGEPQVASQQLVQDQGQQQKGGHQAGDVARRHQPGQRQVGKRNSSLRSRAHTPPLGRSGSIGGPSRPAWPEGR